MTKLYVEGWAPEYGSPLSTDQEMADADRVDTTVEVEGDWTPLAGRDDGVARVFFVDGVRRVDARLTIDDPEGPIPGICGSLGVGAVLWDRVARRSEVARAEVDRIAVFGRGRTARVPVAGARLSYRSESVADPDPGMLVQHFHGRMRDAEAVLTEELAAAGEFVVADGPINDLSATEKVGYVKTHRVPYLPPERMPIIGQIAAGQRTPMFTLGQYRRYSWYLRLAAVQGGHSWSGVVRCEVSGAIGLDRARRLADRTAAILPLVASEAHIDPRAPQNLVPIAALERDLRRRLGDPRFVYRKLREAVMRQGAPEEVVA
jgi:uncharacterized protein